MKIEMVLERHTLQRAIFLKCPQHSLKQQRFIESYAFVVTDCVGLFCKCLIKFYIKIKVKFPIPILINKNSIPTIIMIQVEELRAILTQISLENQHSCLQDLPLSLDQLALHDSDPISEAGSIQPYDFKNIWKCILTELGQKKQQLDNTVRFSLYLLEEYEKVSSENQRIDSLYLKLDEDFNKLLVFNEDLSKNLEKIEEQNTQYRQLIEEQKHSIKTQIEREQLYLKEQIDETSTCLGSQLQNGQGYEKISIISEQPTTKTLQLENFSQNFSSPAHNFACHKNYTERSPSQTHTQYEEILSVKDGTIQSLQGDIDEMRQKIIQLEQELIIKKSELQLADLYYKEKIQLFKRAHSITRLNEEIEQQQGENVNSSLDSNSFKDLQIRSKGDKDRNIFGETRYEGREDYVNEVSTPLESSVCSSEQADEKRNSSRRKSLMQDFHFEPQLIQLNSTSKFIEPTSKQMMVMGKMLKKSCSSTISHLTTKSTKCIQTEHFPFRKSKKSSTFKDSCSGFGTSKKDTSLLNKCKDLSGEVFTLVGGLFDLASKRIVTNRIKSKHASIVEPATLK